MAKKSYEVKVREITVRTLLYEVQASSKAGALREAKYRHRLYDPDETIHMFDAYSEFGEPFCIGVKHGSD